MSQYNVFDLNESHKNNITKFISFIKQKEQKVINEVGYIINDFYNGNITDTVYNAKDLKNIFSNFEESIKSLITDEIGYFTSLQMVYLQLIFHSAEEKKITLNAETSQVENINNINQINDLIKMITSTIPSYDFGKKTNVGKLSSVSNTQQLINDFEELKEKYEFLLNEHDVIKTQNSLLIKENENMKVNSSQFNKEIASMSSQIEKLSFSNKADEKYLDSVKKLEKELSETKKSLDQQIEKYQQLATEYDKKLSESIQFKQLRKYVNDKNSLINELRKKITEYEEKK